MKLTSEFYTKDYLYEIWEEAIRWYLSNPTSLAAEAAEFLGCGNDDPEL